MFSPLPTPSRSQNRAIPVSENDEDDFVTDIGLDARFSPTRGVNIQADQCPSRSLPNRPSISSVQSTENSPRDDDAQRLHPSSNSNLGGINDTQKTSNMPSLEEALEFERRKKQAAQHQRRITYPSAVIDGSGDQSSRLTLRSTPSTGRSPAVAVVQSHAQSPSSPDTSNAAPSSNRSCTESNPRPNLHGKDSSTYFMRHQSSQPSGGRRLASTPLKRIPTDKLPLESISEDSAIHHLSTTFTCNYGDLPSLVGVLSNFDTYIQSGNVSYDILRPPSSDIIHSWRRKVLEMIQQQHLTHADAAPRTAVPISIGNIPSESAEPKVSLISFAVEPREVIASVSNPS